MRYNKDIYNTMEARVGYWSFSYWGGGYPKIKYKEQQSQELLLLLFSSIQFIDA